MNSETSTQGYDSFLDIVANLVGILIILVVVIGAQAAEVWHDAGEKVRQADASLETIRNDLAEEASNLQGYNAELRTKIDYQQRLNHRLLSNRQRMLVSIESQKRNLAQRSEELDESQSKALQIQAQIDLVQQQIEQVKFEFSAVDHAAKSVVETIDHYPTPIAKTVFAEEVHFRIERNRIVYVPMDELIAAMKSEWQVKAKKITVTENTWQTVGPIDNFRLQYQLRYYKNPQNRSQTTVKFERFVLQPVAHEMGETVENALVNGSEFNQRLSFTDPSRTTVAFWVYPDSYKSLNEIRAVLRDRGFQTAYWPMSFGQTISGGPNGFRSTTN